MVESAFNQSMSLIMKCMQTLKHCAQFDVVSESYLNLLSPIYRVLMVPEPVMPNGGGWQFLPGLMEQNVQELVPAKEVIMEHILDLLRAPYGGESAILEQDPLKAVNHSDVPEEYRFIYDTPEYSRFLIQQELLQRPLPPRPEDIQPASQNESDESDFIRLNGAPPWENRDPSKPARYPFGSKEEYEEFFRRSV